jgi:hypothetical protein
MQAFVTPLGTVRAAHVVRPLITPLGSIWYVDLIFDPLWSAHPANGALAGLYRFVAVAPPSIHDAKGRAQTLAGEVGRGSVVRIAGNHLTRYSRTVMTMKAVSVIKMIEPDNVFSQLETAQGE